jgi:hypothetical protein
MKGVHAAIVTHFDSDLNVDQEAIAADVRRLIADGIHGIVPNGTVGEGGTLSRDERRIWSRPRLPLRPELRCAWACRRRRPSRRRFTRATRGRPAPSG